MQAPKLTVPQLDKFLERVMFWERTKAPLNHIWFEQDAVSWVRKAGYTFSPEKTDKGKRYFVEKL